MKFAKLIIAINGCNNELSKCFGVPVFLLHVVWQYMQYYERAIWRLFDVFCCSDHGISYLIFTIFADDVYQRKLSPNDSFYFIKISQKYCEFSKFKFQSKARKCKSANLKPGNKYSSHSAKDLDLFIQIPIRLYVVYMVLDELDNSC